LGPDDVRQSDSVNTKDIKAENEYETKRLFTVLAAGLMLAGLMATAVAKAPKRKMTTSIPEEITTPD
jgi:hypothetical protein